MCARPRLTPPWNRLLSGLVLLGLVLLAPPPAWSRVDVRGAVGWADYPDFGLQLANRDYEVDYAGAATPGLLDTRSYTIFFLEPVTDSTRVGFALGRLDLSQPDRVATRGMTLSGYHLGLTVRSDWQLASALALRGELYLGYADVDGRTAAQTTELSWSEAAAGLDAVLHLGETLRLSLGNRWLIVDGEERSFGAVDSNSSFEIDGAGTPRLGVEFAVDRSGLVGVSFQRGRQDGFMMYFQRRYR